MARFLSLLLINADRVILIEPSDTRLLTRERAIGVPLSSINAANQTRGATRRLRRVAVDRGRVQDPDHVERFSAANCVPGSRVERHRQAPRRTQEAFGGDSVSSGPSETLGRTHRDRAPQAREEPWAAGASAR